MNRNTVHSVEGMADRPSSRFRASIGADRSITVPEEIAGLFRSAGELEVTLRVPPGRSRRSGPAIDPAEVAAIAALQAEPPDAVLRCLASQGALRHRKPGGTPRRRKSGAR